MLDAFYWLTAIIYRAFYGSTLRSVMISDDESVKAFADKVCSKMQFLFNLTLIICESKDLHYSK